MIHAINDLFTFLWEIMCAIWDIFCIAPIATIVFIIGALFISVLGYQLITKDEGPSSESSTQQS